MQHKKLCPSGQSFFLAKKGDLNEKTAPKGRLTFIVYHSILCDVNEKSALKLRFSLLHKNIFGNSYNFPN